MTPSLWGTAAPPATPGAGPLRHLPFRHGERPAGVVCRRPQRACPDDRAGLSAHAVPMARRADGHALSRSSAPAPAPAPVADPGELEQRYCHDRARRVGVLHRAEGSALPRARRGRRGGLPRLDRGLGQLLAAGDLRAARPGRGAQRQHRGGRQLPGPGGIDGRGIGDGRRHHAAWHRRRSVPTPEPVSAPRCTTPTCCSGPKAACRL